MPAWYNFTKMAVGFRFHFGNTSMPRYLILVRSIIDFGAVVAIFCEPRRATRAPRRFFRCRITKKMIEPKTLLISLSRFLINELRRRAR